MAKTYIPTLLFIVARILRYMADWDAKLQANLPPSTVLEFKAMRDAIQAFMDKYNSVEPESE